MFSGRDRRTQFNALYPEIDGDGFREGLHSHVADRQQFFKRIWDPREALLWRCEEARRIREHRNTEISRTAAGTRVMVGDLVLVKEADAVLAREASQTRP